MNKSFEIYPEFAKFILELESEDAGELLKYKAAELIESEYKIVGTAALALTALDCMIEMREQKEQEKSDALCVVKNELAEMKNMIECQDNDNK